MSLDPIRRGAARTATLVAVPVAVVVLGVSALTFGGFGTDPPAPAATGPVTMTPRELPTGSAAACQLLVSKLPDTVAGHARRPVTAGAEQNAAYGDPPVTLECGTSLPTIGLTDEVINLAAPGATSGVCWYPIDGDNRTVWTTVDRQVPVTVTVPGARDGSAQSVVPFSEAISENLTPRDIHDVPTGCSADPQPS
jgi:hypothetical protein